MVSPRIGFTAIVLLLGAAVANAQIPAEPQVTLGADLKVLRFDWEPIPGATFYRLWVNAAGKGFRTVGDRMAASVTHAEVSIAAHLHDWRRTRYVVTACNAAGCNGSAALDPGPHVLEAIGYLKASNTNPVDAFGATVALSDDGYTLAVTAAGEDSNASGVNGNQANNSSADSGAVYVFRRRGNAWHQEAYLKASTNQPQQNFGISGRAGLALSADGSLLVAGAPGENANGFENVGAVYIYRRIQNAWSLMTRLDSPQPQRFDGFGTLPEISDDGRTLKVNSIQPSNPEGPEYRTHTYLRSGDAWQRFATLAPFCRGDQCLITRMSGDGQTLVSYCVTSPTEVRLVTMKRAANTWVHVSDLPIDFVVPQDAMALNPDGTVMALAEFGVTNTVGVYHWIGGNWVRVQGFLPPADSDTFGFELALSNDARLVVVGDFEARQLGAGVTVFPMSGTEEQGAVYIFVHTAGGSWELRNVVKSPNPGLNDQFGISISMSATGRTLAVGASGEDSSATGIDGNRTHEDAPEAGAAYLY